jgi:serine/threonine-protein kinase SRPK3
VEVPQGTSLEQSEEFLEGKNKEMFLNFVRGMLQWRPEDRKTARQLLKDPWLNDQVTVPGCSTALAREGTPRGARLN